MATVSASPAPKESLASHGSKPILPTIHVTGLTLMLLAPGLFAAFLVEWAYADSHDEWALLIPAVGVLAVGFTMWKLTWSGRSIRPSSVFSVVALAWLLSAMAGSVPYLLGDMFDWAEWDLALFESVSGFSCTGATVLIDIESQGKGILLWRQLTQWYGGMGMVVLALTVLPFLGVGGLSLMTAEAPGQESDRLAHRVTETARRLWRIYIGITLVIALALWATPQMGLYESFAHSLTTAATGGFSTRGASIGAYDSVLVESIVIVGMLVCAINFGLHHAFLKGDRGAYRRSSETLVFLAIFVGASGVLTLINWWKGSLGLAEAFRHSMFNVASISTSTGFGSANGAGSAGDYAAWAPGAVLVMLLLYVVGGNVGSTAGGVKVFRFQVAVSHMVRQIQRVRHPNGVIPVKLGRTTIPDKAVARVMGFLGLYFVIAVTAMLAITFMGVPFMEAGAGVLSALSNMGPGLGEAGPAGSFLGFPKPARLILTLLMMVGRLELIAVVMMFSSVVSVWRRHRGRLGFS